MRRATLLLVVVMLSFSMLMITAGCQSARVSVGYDKPPPPPPPGPPPWAPAHGRRAKYVYHYYPDVAVYYYPVSGVYFYYSGGRWHVSARLPATIRIETRTYVVLEMDVDKPYVYHGKVREWYPPGYKMRQKGKAWGKGKKGYY